MDVARIQQLFSTLEQKNGTRFSWNVFPSDRAEAAKNVLPLACLYTPNCPIALEPLPYPPVRCHQCSASLNPFCTVDFNTKVWVCPFCLGRNQFPANYSEISDSNRPAELIPEYTTLEYSVVDSRTNVPSSPPAFLFVLDTCLDEKSFGAMKDAVLLALQRLPPDALIGLITFGATAQLYELAFPLCPKSYVFRGNGPGVTLQQINALLGTPHTDAKRAPAPQPQAARAPPAANRFLRPLSEVESLLESILEELQRDGQTVKAEKRALRCTGVAMSLAVGVLERVAPGRGARAVLLTGGPATQGAGMVVGDDLKESVRSWSDLTKDKAKHAYAARKVYDELAVRCAAAGHVIDVFGCGLDDSGLYEMQELVRQTNGLFIMAGKFHSEQFQSSFAKVLRRDAQGRLAMALSGQLSVQTSRDLKVLGAIGHVSSLDRKTPYVSADKEPIGVGGTSAWKLNSLDPSTTVCVYLDVANHPQASLAGQCGLLQFHTTYVNAQGAQVLRVTTVCCKYADPTHGKQGMLIGFDQEAAAVALARWAVWKAAKEGAFDILRWLDRLLIRACATFGEFVPNDPGSFRLPPTMALFPQFMFHLRRSSLLQVFGFSPDETTYFRFALLRETVGNALTIIQPTLDAYSFEGGCQPVLLSSASVQPNRILLLDSFFSVVVFRGDTIAQWVKAGYDKDPAHESFQKLLAWPRADAEKLVEGRFPTPRLIECDQYSSQARFLLAVLDPAVTHASQGAGAGGEAIPSEDVSLEVFLEHLKKLAVAPK